MFRLPFLDSVFIRYNITSSDDLIEARNSNPIDAVGLIANEISDLGYLMCRLRSFFLWASMFALACHCENKLLYAKSRVTDV